MGPLVFQGTISVKDRDRAAQKQAESDALDAFNKISTSHDAYLVICHDGSYRQLGRDQTGAGAAAVCNKHWLPKSTQEADANNQRGHAELIEESVGFESMTDSLLAEEVACSLACDMALRELKRNEAHLEKGSTVHLTLIGDCTSMWHHIDNRRFLKNRAITPHVVRDYIAYQSQKLHRHAATLDITLHLRGLWCPRSGYNTVTYLGRADFLAGKSAQSPGKAYSSLIGNRFTKPAQFPTWLHILGQYITPHAKVVTNEHSLSHKAKVTLLAGIEAERKKVEKTLSLVIEVRPGRKRKADTQDPGTARAPKKARIQQPQNAPAAAGDKANRTNKRNANNGAGGQGAIKKQNTDACPQ